MRGKIYILRKWSLKQLRLSTSNNIQFQND